MENIDLQEGIRCYKSGEFDKGLSIFDRLINQKCATFQLYYYQGNCLFGKKQYELAVDAYTKANKLNNDYEEQLQYKIGECNKNMQKYDEAIQCFDLVINLRGKGVKSGLYAKSQTQYEAGLYTEAIKTLKEYKKCLDLQSKYQANIELSLCYLKIDEYFQVYKLLHNTLDKTSNISNDHFARIYYSLAKACKFMCLYQEAPMNFDKMRSKLNAIDSCDTLYYNHYLSCNFNSVIAIGNNKLKSSVGFPSNKKENMLCIYVGNAYCFFEDKNLCKVKEWHSKYKDNLLDSEYNYEMAKYHLFNFDLCNAFRYLKVFESDGQTGKFIPGLMLLASYYTQVNQLQKRDCILENVKHYSVFEKILNQYNDYMKKLNLPNLCLLTESKTEEREIGKGGFGRILLRTEGNKREYVVKMVVYDTIIDENKKKNIKLSLLNEINIFAELEHPNIVRHYGFNGDSELYLEYCPGKDLASYLQKQTSFNFICYVINQIAKGLKYLHDKEIIHGDMKTKNILLSKEYKSSEEEKEEDYPIIKICDFGLARSMQMGIEGIGGMTVAYAAPELFVKNAVTTKQSDVYAFGVIINELITKQFPFNNLNQEAIIQRVQGGQRPDANENNLESVWDVGIGEKIRNIMKKCWDQDPNKRMIMEEVCINLNITS